jgi:hypothetical protein
MGVNNWVLANRDLELWFASYVGESTDYDK